MMSNTVETKTFVKFFFVWSEDKEAIWLREMANKGWHLVRASVFNYTFRKGEPADYVYQFDFRLKAYKDETEYLEIFTDAGWEYINRVFGWYYFRKKYREGEQNEIYSDKESLIQKYKKLLFFMVLCLLPLIYSMLSMVLTSERFIFSRAVLYFDLAILLLWGYAFIRVIRYVRKLSRK